MATRAPRGGQRAEALSRQRIVATAIEILDAEGERALTFRALTTRLATGNGAIYWHVADKDELLAACAADVVSGATAGVDPRGTSEGTSEGSGATAEDAAGARERVRAVALAVFDAIAARPWVGAQLSREPWEPAALQVFEAVGAPLAAMGVPAEAQFDAASVLHGYVLGLAGQYGAGARVLDRAPDEAAALAVFTAGWARLDDERHPFVARMREQLADHDDREQFAAGIDLILTGIAATTAPA